MVLVQVHFVLVFRKDDVRATRTEKRRERKDPPLPHNKPNHAQYLHPPPRTIRHKHTEKTKRTPNITTHKRLQTSK